MTTETPLAIVDPDSLTALFGGDPSEKPDEDIVELCTELRRRRSVFASDEAVKALKDKNKRAKATDPASPALADKPSSELSLDDL